LRKEVDEILQVRSYNQALSLKVAELEGCIIYLEDQLESESQFKEQQREFKNKEELLLAQVKKHQEDIKKHQKDVEALKDENALMYV